MMHKKPGFRKQFVPGEKGGLREGNRPDFAPRGIKQFR